MHVCHKFLRWYVVKQYLLVDNFSGKISSEPHAALKLSLSFNRSVLFSPLLAKNLCLDSKSAMQIYADTTCSGFYLWKLSCKQSSTVGIESDQSIDMYINFILLYISNRRRRHNLLWSLIFEGAKQGCGRRKVCVTKSLHLIHLYVCSKHFSTGGYSGIINFCTRINFFVLEDTL